MCLLVYMNCKQILRTINSCRVWHLYHTSFLIPVWKLKLMWKKKILSTYMWPFFSNIWYLVDASVYRSIFNYTHSMYISLPLYDNESISPNFEHFKSNVLTVLCDFLFIIRFFVHSFICLCVFLWHGRAINLVSNVISGTEVWDGYGIYISNLASTVISGTEVWDGYGIYISKLIIIVSWRNKLHAAMLPYWTYTISLFIPDSVIVIELCLVMQ